MSYKYKYKVRQVVHNNRPHEIENLAKVKGLIGTGWTPIAINDVVVDGEVVSIYHLVLKTEKKKQ